MAPLIQKEQSSAFMRNTAMNVRPWFEAYGKVLDHVPSFHHQREIITREIEDYRPILRELVICDLPDLANELRKELDDAEKLVAAIGARISELETAALKAKG